jgi:hypothetical protein
MALKIPIYDQPQVRAAKAPTPQMNPGAAPNLGAAVGRGLGEVGAAMEKAQKEADQQVVMEKHTAFQSVLNGMTEKAAMLQGDDIRNPEKYGGAKEESFSAASARQIAEARTKLEQGMNARQLQMFHAYALPASESTGHALRLHENKQIDAVKDQTADALVKSSLSSAVNSVRPDGSFDEHAFNLAVGTGADALGTVYDRKGVVPEVAESTTKSFTSSALKATLNKMFEMRNSAGAEQALAKFGHYLTDDDRAEYLKKTKSTDDRNKGLLAAQEALSLFSNDKDRTVRVSDGIKFIDEKFKDNPEAREAAILQFKDRANAVERDWDESENVLAGQAFKMLTSGSSWSSIQQFLGTAKLPGKKEAEFMAYAKSWYKKDEAATNKQEAIAQTARYMDLVLHPEKIAQMSEKDLMASIPLLGPTFARAIAADKANLMAGKAAIDNDDLLTAVAKFDWLDSKGKVKPAHAEDLIGVKSAVEREIEDLQKNRGPVSREEKIKVVRRNMAVAQVARQDKRPGLEQLPMYRVSGRDRVMLVNNWLVTQKGFTPASLAKMTPQEFSKYYDEMRDSMPTEGF